MLSNAASHPPTFSIRRHHATPRHTTPRHCCSASSPNSSGECRSAMYGSSVRNQLLPPRTAYPSLQPSRQREQYIYSSSVAPPVCTEYPAEAAAHFAYRTAERQPSLPCHFLNPCSNQSSLTPISSQHTAAAASSSSSAVPTLSRICTEPLPHRRCAYTRTTPPGAVRSQQQLLPLPAQPKQPPLNTAMTPATTSTASTASSTAGSPTARSAYY